MEEPIDRGRVACAMGIHAGSVGSIELGNVPVECDERAVAASILSDPRKLAGPATLSFLCHLGALALVAMHTAVQEPAEALRGGEAVVEVELVAVGREDSVAADAAPAASDATAPSQKASTQESDLAEAAPEREAAETSSVSGAREPLLGAAKKPDEAPQSPEDRRETPAEHPPAAPSTEQSKSSVSPVRAITIGSENPIRSSSAKLNKTAPAVHRESAHQPRENQPAHDTGRGHDAARNIASSKGGTAGTSDTAGVARTASWRSEVLAHLARFKQYPSQARDREIIGCAIVAFTLSPRGDVLAVALAGSSGSPILDEATLAMVHRAAPFPPMPGNSSARASFKTAINYNLH